MNMQNFANPEKIIINLFKHINLNNGGGPALFFLYTPSVGIAILTIRKLLKNFLGFFLEKL